MSSHVTKKRIKVIVAVLVFALLGIAVLQGLNTLFIPKTAMYESNKKYHSLPDGSVDVLFVGGSSYLRGINPMYLWKEYGIASFNRSAISITPKITHLYTIDAIETQKPKMVMLYPGRISEGSYNLDKDAFIGPTLHSMNAVNLSVQKIKTAYDIGITTEKYNSLHFILPILKYHNRWSELTKFDFTGTQDGYTRGNNAIWTVRDQSKHFDAYKNKMIDVNSDAAYSFNDEAVEYYEKTIEYCQDNDVEVVLLCLPKFSWDSSNYNATKALAEKYGLKYIDMNIEDVYNDLHIDNTRDWYDKYSHVNGWGSIKIGDYIGKYLKENYDLEDKRKGDSPAVRMFQSDYKEYYDTFSEMLPESLSEAN